LIAVKLHHKKLLAC